MARLAPSVASLGVPVMLALGAVARASAPQHDACDDLSGAVGASAVAPLADDQIWRSAASSGANVLWLMLQAHGFECSYASILKRVKAEGRSTAAHLAEIAADCGAHVQVCRASLGALTQLNLPVIVHFEAAQRNAGYAESGCFGLVVGCDRGADIVDVINGASGLRDRMRIEDFCSLWSGVAVVIPASLWEIATRTPALTGLALAAVGLTVWWKRRRWYATP